MKKPQPKYEIHTVLEYTTLVLRITVESRDMAQRLETEVVDFGMIKRFQGNIESDQMGAAGLVSVTTENEYYRIRIRPTFDCVEVARWLGRGGIVEIVAAPANKRAVYIPEDTDQQ